MSNNKHTNTNIEHFGAKLIAEMVIGLQIRSQDYVYEIWQNKILSTEIVLRV